MSSADLNDSQVSRLQDSYAFWDKKNEGITAATVKNVMTALGRKITEPEIVQAIAQVDTKKSGKVDFPDFLNVVASRELREAQGLSFDKDKDLKDVFDAFDKAGGGRIASHNLRNVFGDLGENVTDEEMRELLKLLGGKSYIDYEGFCNLYQNGPIGS